MIVGGWRRMFHFPYNRPNRANMYSIRVNILLHFHNSEEMRASCDPSGAAEAGKLVNAVFNVFYLDWSCCFGSKGMWLEHIELDRDELDGK